MEWERQDEVMTAVQSQYPLAKVGILCFDTKKLVSVSGLEDHAGRRVARPPRSLP